MESIVIESVQAPNLASQIRVAFSSMAWNTGSSSPGDALMTRSTSAVAVCCSNASSRSRVSTAIFVSWLTAEELRPTTAFDVVRRRILAGSPLCLGAPSHRLPLRLRTRHRSGSKGRFDRGLKPASTAAPLARSMSALGQKRTHAPQQTTSLFDDLIGAREQRRRHGQAKRLGGLNVDDQLKFGRLLDGQIGRFRALEIRPA